MRLRFAAMAALLLNTLACESGGSGREETELSPEQRVAAYFAENLVQCTGDAECPTGRCDLTPTFTVSIEKGYCGTFQTAFDRWQKVELATRLAAQAREAPELARAVFARVDEELGYTLSSPQPGYAVRPPEKETLVVLLAALAAPGGGAAQEAIRRLDAMLARESGPVRQLVGLTLAELGRESGWDAMVEASFGASPRLRLHAARAASGLCNELSNRVLASLLEDPHPLVRFGAAQGLGKCRTPEALEVLEQRRAALRRKPGPSGDLSAINSAIPPDTVP